MGVMSKPERSYDLRENLNMMNQAQRCSHRFSSKRKGVTSSSACSEESTTPEQLSKKKGRFIEPETKASSKDWFDLTKKYEELQDGLQTRLQSEKKVKKEVELEDDPVT